MEANARHCLLNNCQVTAEGCNSFVRALPLLTDPPFLSLPRASGGVMARKNHIPIIAPASPSHARCRKIQGAQKSHTVSDLEKHYSKLV